MKPNDSSQEHYASIRGGLSRGASLVGEVGLGNIGVASALGFSMFGDEGTRGKNIADKVFDSIEGSSGMTKYDLIGMIGNMALEDNKLLMKKFPKLSKAYSAVQDPAGWIDMADPYNFNQVPARGDLSAQAKLLFGAVEGGRLNALDGIFTQTYGKDILPKGCLGYYPDKCPDLVNQWCDLDKTKWTDMSANKDKYVWCTAKNDITLLGECKEGPTGPIADHLTKWKTDADEKCKLLSDNPSKLVWCDSKDAVTLHERCPGSTGPISCPIPKDTSKRSCTQYKALETRFANDIPRYYNIKKFRPSDFDCDGCMYLDGSNFKEPIDPVKNPLIPYQFMLNQGDCPSEYRDYYNDYYIKHHPDTQVLNCSFFDGYLDMKTYAETGETKFTTDFSRATTECSYDDTDKKYYKLRYKIVKQPAQNGGKECPAGTVDGTLIEKELCPSQDCTFDSTSSWYHEYYNDQNELTRGEGWSNCFQDSNCKVFHDSSPLTVSDKLTFLTSCVTPTDCSESTDPNCREFPEECKALQYRLKNNSLSSDNSNYFITNCTTGPIVSDSYNPITRVRTTVRGPISDDCKILEYQKNNSNKKTLNSEDEFYYNLFSCDQKKEDGSFDLEQWYQYRQRTEIEPAKYGGQCDNYQVRNQYNQESQCKPADCKYTEWTSPSECGLYDTETMTPYSLPEGWYSLQTREATEQGAYGGIQCSEKDTDYVKFTSCPTKDCVLDTEWKTSDCYIDSADGVYKKMKFKSVIEPPQNGGICNGPEIGFELCPQNECKVSPDWSSWSNCELGPDGNTFVRYRQKELLELPSGNQNCAPLIQQEVCNSQNCTVSVWSNWGTCASNGNGGYSQTRTRRITQQPRFGGTSCPSTIETRVCQPETLVGNISNAWNSLFSSSVSNTSSTPIVQVTPNSKDISGNYQQYSQQGTQATATTIPQTKTSLPPSSMLNDLGKALRSLF